MFCGNTRLAFWQDLYQTTLAVKVKTVLAGKWQYVAEHNPRYPVITRKKLKSGHQNRKGGSEDEKSPFGESNSE